MCNGIKILDCTLRDGGYCNQWKFGKGNIKKIIKGLIKADIDIIECGFMTNRISYDENITKYISMEQAVSVLPENQGKKLFVCMINYGEYDINDIPNRSKATVDGIRVAFHKKDIVGAIEFCKEIQSKGYIVFVQAMLSLSYSNSEFLNLINMVNGLFPYAFYIVDSFGAMKKEDMVRLFSIVEKNLSEGISVGYHSHNNMQLAYSNAQEFVELGRNRSLIIDSSIYGMGRGAGNLNTELFVDYLNDAVGANYRLDPLLIVIDEILNSFYQQNYWGYSLANYLSAVHNVHPDYARYLDDKKTLAVKDINKIFDMMKEENKVYFNKEYIENLYIDYMSTGYVQEEHKEELIKKIEGKDILLIAPGKSSYDEKDRIIEFNQRQEAVSISVNFDYSYADVDYIFISNLRRVKQLDKKKKKKCIVTSNIPDTDVFLRTRYQELINDYEMVKDNAGMMAIKFFINCGIKKIFLAGFDGYTHDNLNNYGDGQMSLATGNSILDAMNEGITHVLKEYSAIVEIIFITSTKYET